MINRNVRSWFGALALMVGVIHAASAASVEIGPKLGTAIPQPFAAQDSAGKAVTFTDLTGSTGAVLVFVRSAAWCPYCIQQLRDVQKVADAVKARGYHLVSISYDSPEVLAGFAEKYGITYRLVADQGSKIIDAWGIRDPQYKEGSRAYGVPLPGIFIVDKTGVVRAKLAEDGYKVRPPSEAILAAIDGVAPKP
jgi:peroxiredoxin